MNRDLHVLLANLWLAVGVLHPDLSLSILSFFISAGLFITIPTRSKK